VDAPSGLEEGSNLDAPVMNPPLTISYSFAVVYIPKQALARPQ
jgi:hypothetical protein